MNELNFSDNLAADEMNLPCYIQNKQFNRRKRRVSKKSCLVTSGNIYFMFNFSTILLYMCNVRQSALQKFLKISIKNSKCAVSNKHIQDGRPGRYENRRGSKIKAKHHQKTPPPPRNENVRDAITQKARESGILPSDSKKTGFWQKSAK